MAEEVIRIDSDLRRIILPNDFVFGVYNDKNVVSLPFEVPRYYDSIDLSEFNFQINYLNAAKQGSVYFVPAPVVETDKITFNWVLGRGVFAAAGTVKFIVCLRLTTLDGEILKEFNTTVASGSVLEGIEIDTDEEEAYDILTSMRSIQSSVSLYAEEITESIRTFNTDLSTFLGAVEDSYVATTSYSSGDYVFINHVLYKVTDSISSGDDIIPDTNVTATSLLEELKSLASS